MTAKNFFSKEEQEDIKQAIMNAELDTSGEIRVHIENSCSGDVKERAAFLFNLLKMNKTKQRNGVLIYLAVQNRRFAVLGDQGINHVVPENFWDDIKQGMMNYFRSGEFVEGLIYAISTTGLQLKNHFPYQTSDVNELPDEISFGEEPVN